MHPDAFNLAARARRRRCSAQATASERQITNRILSLDMPTLIDQLHGTVALDATLANAQISAVLHPFNSTAMSPHSADKLHDPLASPDRLGADSSAASGGCGTIKPWSHAMTAVGR